MTMRSRQTLEWLATGLVGSAALGAIPAPAAAQESEGLTVDVGRCVELASPAERLACFEAQVERARGTGAASAADEAPPRERAAADAAAGAAREAPADRRGVASARGDGEAPAEDRRKDIVATITELRETVPNNYLITLDNGQVWRQMRPMPYALRPGIEVRIYGTRWGSASRLTAPSLRGYIQVERVR